MIFKNQKIFNSDFTKTKWQIYINCVYNNFSKYVYFGVSKGYFVSWCIGMFVKVWIVRSESGKLVKIFKKNCTTIWFAILIFKVPCVHLRSFLKPILMKWLERSYKHLRTSFFRELLHQWLAVLLDSRWITSKSLAKKEKDHKMIRCLWKWLSFFDLLLCKLNVM